MTEHIVNTLSKVIDKDCVHEIIGKNVEFTIAFDKEEPKQYLYVKGAFVKFNIEKMDGIMANLTEHAGDVIRFAMVDLEVYKEENIHHWLDYRRMIEEQSKDALVYDDNVTGNEKYPEKNIDIDPEGVSENQLYDYFDANTPKHSNEDYINKFQFVTKMLVNRLMESYLNRNKITVYATLGYNLELVKALQTYFSAVDFTEFTKNELSTLGFMNHKDLCMLVPVWAYPVVLKNHLGKEMISVFDKNVVIGVNELSHAAKFGCLSFGFRISDIKQDESENISEVKSKGGDIGSN